MRASALATRLGVAIGLVGVALIVAATPEARADEAEKIRGTIARAAPTLADVQLALVLHLPFGRPEAMEVAIPGAIVSPAGLCVLSAGAVSTARLRERFASVGGPGADRIRVEVTEARVQLGDASYPGELVFVDDRLDLAVIQIHRDANDEGESGAGKQDGAALAPLPALELASAPRHPQVGEEVITLYRLGADLGGAPVVAVSRVAGVLERPRRGWILDPPPPVTGVPVFSLAGELLGVSILLAPAPEDGAGMLGPAIRDVLGGPPRTVTLLLPGKLVDKLVQKVARSLPTGERKGEPPVDEGETGDEEADD